MGGQISDGHPNQMEEKVGQTSQIPQLNFFYNTLGHDVGIRVPKDGMCAYSRVEIQLFDMPQDGDHHGLILPDCFLCEGTSQPKNHLQHILFQSLIANNANLSQILTSNVEIF
jgi:hypothetical protein